MAMRTFCDYCERQMKKQVEYVGDLDSRNLGRIKVTPVLLNKTSSVIHNPDLCRECVIKILRG